MKLLPLLSPARSRAARLAALPAMLILGAGACQGVSHVRTPAAERVGRWSVHDMTRPKPPVVTPGAFSTQEQPGRPPSDAVVLYGGGDLGAWTDGKQRPAAWTLGEGYFEVGRGKGSLYSKQAFGDAQIHLEWASPVPARGQGQNRGNSGLKIMDRYEVQILDSYDNVTYADGYAGAVYAQYPPLANATLPPGAWQVYDIVFRRPRFDAEGKIVRPARITAFHNGVLIQDNVELSGPTGKARESYRAHADKLPLMLQDHGHPVRYRNIWVRELQEEE